MRNYRQNSPQAAARIVALTLIADRDIGQAELEIVYKRGFFPRGGIGHTVYTLYMSPRSFSLNMR